MEQYNAALKERVERFAKANKGVEVKVVETTGPFMEAIEDPKAYGAENATCFDESGTKCLWWNDVSLFPCHVGDWGLIWEEADFLS